MFWPIIPEPCSFSNPHNFQKRSGLTSQEVGSGLWIAEATWSSRYRLSSVLLIAWAKGVIGRLTAVSESISESEIDVSDHGEKGLWIGSSGDFVVIPASSPELNSVSSS